MKKLILSLMAAGVTASSFAQIGKCLQQGNVLLYGVGTYTNSHGSDTRSFANANSSTVDQPRRLNWEVSPGLGFNITDNVAVGVEFDYTGSKTNYDRKSISFYNQGYGMDQMKTFDYRVGPFVRYTKAVGEHFFVFGQFTAQYLRGRETPRYTNLAGTNSFSLDDNYKGVGASFMPAVGLMVSHSVGLTFGVGGISYEYRKYDYHSDLPVVAGSEHTAKTNDFMVTFGRQFNVGLQKYFGCGRGHHMHHAEEMDETRHMDTSDDNDNDEGGRKHRRHHKDDEE